MSSAERSADSDSERGDAPSAAPSSSARALAFAPLHFDRRVCLMQMSEQQFQCDSVSLHKIPHPKHEAAAKGAKGNEAAPDVQQETAILIHDGNCFEVQRCHRHPQAWLLGDSVNADGGLYLFTRVDPLFLVITLLDRARKKTAESDGVFMEWDQIVESWPEYPVFVEHFRDRSRLRAFEPELICDVRRSGGSVFYRLNDDLLNRWVVAKAAVLADEFGRNEQWRQVSMHTSAVSSSFQQHSADVLGETPVADANIDVVAIAMAIISEYVPLRFVRPAAAALGFGDKYEPVPQRTLAGALKRRQAETSLATYQGGGREGDELAANEPKRRKEGAERNAERNEQVKKKLGLASISSFFTKKSK